ncbi:MAG: 6-phosphogluconolactonase [Acidimicrobiia bacterium]
MSLELVIRPTTDDVADTLAEDIADHVTSAFRPTIGLAGGGTPAATYRRCSGLDLPWADTLLWLADERWVPADHPDSNARMINANLRPGATRLVTANYDLGDPGAAAAEYEQILDEVFADDDGRPDLVLLGIGDDGHTASLFPGTDALDQRERRYVANYVPDKDAWRLTATLPLLWAARRVWFLVTGESKADVVAAILDEGAPYPAGLVSSGTAEPTWYLDEAAASRLRRPT